jgi:protein required for attachment to host cells
MLERNFDLVLVADGQRALCLAPQNNGWRHLSTLWRLESDGPLDHEYGQDRPGRYRGGAGLPRSAFEVTSHHDAEIAKFLKETIAKLDDTLETGGYKRIAIVASPNATGILRTLMSDRMRQCVVQEIVHDYTRTPQDQLELILLGDSTQR